MTSNLNLENKNFIINDILYNINYHDQVINNEGKVGVCVSRHNLWYTQIYRENNNSINIATHWIVIKSILEKRRLTEEEILYLEIDKEENLDYNYNNKKIYWLEPNQYIILEIKELIEQVFYEKISNNNYNNRSFYLYPDCNTYRNQNLINLNRKNIDNRQIRINSFLEKLYLQVINKEISSNEISLKPDFKIIFHCNENHKEYFLHSFLLNDDYFNVIKSNIFFEKNQSILIVDRFDIINDFIKYIYTGTIDLHLYEKDLIDKDKIYSLKKLANYLMLNDLDELCNLILL